MKTLYSPALTSCHTWYRKCSPVAYLVGTLDFPLQLHLILPLPQHLLAESGEARSRILQLETTPSTNEDTPKSSVIKGSLVFSVQTTTHPAIWRTNWVLSCLFVIWHQVWLELPLGPVFWQLVVSDLGQVEVGHLGGGALHPAAGCPLRIGLPLSFQSLVLLALLGCLWVRGRYR